MLNQVVCSHIRNCDLGDIDVLGNPHIRYYLKSRSASKRWRGLLDERMNVGEEEGKAPDFKGNVSGTSGCLRL